MKNQRKIIIFALILLAAVDLTQQQDCSQYENCAQCSFGGLRSVGSTFNPGLRTSTTQGFMGMDQGDTSNPKVYRWDGYSTSRDILIYASYDYMMSNWGTPSQRLTASQSTQGSYKAVFRGYIFAQLSIDVIGKFDASTGALAAQHQIPGAQSSACQWGGGSDINFMPTPNEMYIVYQKVGITYLARIDPDTLALIEEWNPPTLAAKNARGAYMIIGDSFYAFTNYNANPMVSNYKFTWSTGYVDSAHTQFAISSTTGYSTCLHFNSRRNQIWDVNNVVLLMIDVTVEAPECTVCVDHFYITEEHTCDQCSVKCATCSTSFENCNTCAENRDNAPECGCLADHRETDNECIYYCDLENCAALYSRCNYQGEVICVCRDSPISDANSQQNITQIKSAHIPDGAAISLYEGTDFEGNTTMTIDSDTPCMETTVYFGIR